MSKKVADRVKAEPPNGRLTQEELAAVAPNADANTPRQTKIERYGWKVVDEPGQFAMVAKELLLVDHNYQRKDVRPERVRKIASEWSWWACGVLKVARRPDDKLYVYDGQHRKRAADSRADIRELPCMIFRSGGSDPQATEAGGFVRCNVERQRVAAYDLFVADLRRKEPTAVAIDRMVRATGYTIAKTAAPKTVTCVHALAHRHRKDEPITCRVWALSAAVAGGEPVIDRLFTALFRLEQHMVAHKLTLESESFRSVLIDAGADSLLGLMHRHALKVGRGHPTTCANAILEYMNKCRTTKRKIPPITI